MNYPGFFSRLFGRSGYVYYAKFDFPQGTYYKIGFTRKRSLHERMSYGGQGDENYIRKVFFFSYQDSAEYIEQKLLKYFTNHRAFGKGSMLPNQPLYKRGQSELFSSDILGLDTEIYQLKEGTIEKKTQKSKNEGTGCLFAVLGLLLAIPTAGWSLLLVLGGISEFFGTESSGKVTTESYTYYVPPLPKHPPEIQKLIAQLTIKESLEHL